MIIYGTFYDIDNQLIEVEINNSSIQGNQIEIGEDGLFFSADPIQIETNNNDTFQHIIRKSCTINLVTDRYVGNLFFAENSRSVSVEVTKGNECLFYGFIEPTTFNQPYTSPLDVFTINCIDCLSTLQYYNYNNTTIRDFEEKKQAASTVSFYSILTTMFDNSILKGNIYYDKSKGLTSSSLTTIFEDCGIAEQVMIGDSFDDVWTWENTLNEILQYLNLHIIQNGKDYFIFDWNTIKNNRNTWINLISKASYNLPSTSVTLTSQMHSDNNTNITISDVYNQVQVRDDLQGQDTIIESPLDKNQLGSLYTGKQLYMTEYSSEGNGDTARDALVDMVEGNTTTYQNAYTTDWYIQAMNNPNWKCYINGNRTLVETLAEQQNGRYVNQWKLARYLKQHPCVPYIFNFGSVEKKANVSDNSPTSKISMTPYLYISVNGNEIDGENTHEPTEQTLEDLQPILEYVGNNGGGAYSPVDDDTINYLVFSGKVLLQPIQYESSSDGATRSNNYQDILTNGCRKDEGQAPTAPSYNGTSVWGHANNIKSDNNADGRYYTRKFYTIVNPSDEDDPIPYLTDGTCGIQPWTKDKSAHGYQYNYSAYGDSVDYFSKLPLIECELIIGNKRLIEKDMDENGNSTFEWVVIGQEPTYTYDGVSYPITTFSLGINPKIEDYIIGDEFDIQNTINYQMNIDAEGTAIPIKQSDALSGAVIFRILGPVNSLWNQVTKRTHRHFLFWNHSHWSSNTHFVLAHTENIIIKDFECKVYSNNGGYEVNQQKDLIYLSDETNRYINKKDNITFKYITQLSGSEAYAKGLSAGVNINAVVNLTTSLPLTSIYNATTAETAKAEEHYVDQYYTAYSTPKIVMDTQLHRASNITPFNIYHSVPLNKNFFVQNMGMDVRLNKTNITLKEI